jgi:hypothetical protein
MSELTQQLAQRAAAGHLKMATRFIAEFNRQWEQEKRKMFEMADAARVPICGRFSFVTPNLLAVSVRQNTVTIEAVMTWAHPEMKAMYNAGHLKLSNVELKSGKGEGPETTDAVEFDWELQIGALIVEERKKLLRQQEVARNGSRARPTPIQAQPPAKKPKMGEIADHLEEPQMLECVSDAVVDV